MRTNNHINGPIFQDPLKERDISREDMDAYFLPELNGDMEAAEGGDE